MMAIVLFSFVASSEFWNDNDGQLKSMERHIFIIQVLQRCCKGPFAKKSIKVVLVIEKTALGGFGNPSIFFEKSTFLLF